MKTNLPKTGLPVAEECNDIMVMKESLREDRHRTMVRSAFVFLLDHNRIESLGASARYRVTKNEHQTLIFY